jgi:hypothetical protein
MRYVGRFLVGAVLGLPVAVLFFWKGGGFDLSWFVGILAFFGLVAVAFWRWLGMIINAVFAPSNWS